MQAMPSPALHAPAVSSESPTQSPVPARPKACGSNKHQILQTTRMKQMHQAWRDLQTRDASAEDSVYDNRAGMRSHNENLWWYLHVLLTSTHSGKPSYISLRECPAWVAISKLVVARDAVGEDTGSLHTCHHMTALSAYHISSILSR
jgi:cell wall assembly regulator SMI1